ncbi:MAG TPA: hypothetical protein PK156_02750 [Polyangium sp.]|nr:hypothetical protein [Polyangium sp.]
MKRTLNSIRRDAGTGLGVANLNEAEPPAAARDLPSAFWFGRNAPLLASMLVALGGLLAAGCSSNGGGDTTSSSGNGSSSSSGGPTDGGTGDPTTLVGSFQVKLIAPVPATPSSPEVPGSTAVLGKIYDGPTPSAIIWELALQEGACTLSTPRVPFCATPCGGSAACVDDDKCQNYPLAHSAGTVTAKGLHPQAGGDTFMMNPVVNAYQAPGDVKLPYPAFAEGEAISFNAAGDFYQAFTVESVGIAPLVFGAQTITVESGKPIPLTWTAPGQAGISRIYVKLDISHHGGTKGMIECDADDTGSLEISATLVTKLVELGVAGFPTIIVNRKAIGSTTISQGRVDLVVTSSIEQPVEIPGLNSCTANEECPMGQTCQSDLTCK